jgi:hypothetical protein
MAGNVNENLPQAALERLLEVLDKLEIPYLIGGSVAAAVHGIPRFTNDVDLVVDLAIERVGDFVDQLGPRFYADIDTIRGATRVGRSFNIIDTRSAYKMDLFPLSKDAYQRRQFERRVFLEFRVFGSEPIEFAVASPEDTILSKLRWYRLRGEGSQQQWNDVSGIVLVQSGELDLDYLRQWAEYLKVSDPLERLLATEPQSGILNP